MGISEYSPKTLRAHVLVKIKKAQKKRGRGLELLKKKAANVEASRKEGQAHTEDQEMEPSEEEKDQAKSSRDDEGYVNAIPRGKRNQVMAVDPRALLQRYDAGSPNEVPDISSNAEASSSNATSTSTRSS